MKKISFYANRTKSAAGETLRSLAEAASSLGLEVTDSKPECIVVIGGDGTMLAAAHERSGVPLLGLNLGSLGFLASVERPAFVDALAALADDDFRISERTALEVSGSVRVALNEVVISRGVSGHAALLELAVDGKEATRFLADGLVFATPTGSTAYSLSAGGPILMPQSPSLAIVPICPHALASRPLVVPDTSVFKVSLAPRPGADMVQIYSDGSAVRQLKAGESVEIRKSDRSVKFVELGDYNPYRVLERKLGWTGGSFV